jgi:hypothetical protein
MHDVRFRVERVMPIQLDSKIPKIACVPMNTFLTQATKYHLNISLHNFIQTCPWHVNGGSHEPVVMHQHPNRSPSSS